MIYFNIICKDYSVEIKLLQQPYMHWNIYTTDAQSVHLHVSALYGFHRQGVFTVVKVVISK